MRKKNQKQSHINRVVLIVNDKSGVLARTQRLLVCSGVSEVVTLQDGRELLSILERGGVDVILLDFVMPHAAGLELLSQTVQDYPDIPMIVVTAVHELEVAVQCMKAGAFDYLVTPVEESRLVSVVKRALEIRNLRRQVASLKECLVSDALDQQEAFAHIITQSRQMQATFQYVEAVAGSDEPILVTGETGVGKELIVQAIHRVSGRSGKLVSLNVAGLDDHMFSDTLFGHKKGAFTGAEETREGLIGQAAGGTLFLDEIGDLIAETQVKLLRLLQERTYLPLGSDLAKMTDVRIVAATNRDLEPLLKTNAFRADLYYRLSTHCIHVLPLRERREDIPLLAGYFLKEAGRALNKPAPIPPPGFIKLLSSYPFPGNIRELRSLVFDAVARHQSGILSLKSFHKVFRKKKAASLEKHPLDKDDSTPLIIPGRFPTLGEAECFLFEAALKRSGGNQGIAATLLGVTRQTVNRWLKRRKS